MSRSSRTVRKTYLIVTAGVVSLALVAGLHGPAAGAAPPKPDPLWTVEPEKSVPGVDAPVVPRKPDPAEAKAITATPKVEWPSPAVAEVTVPTRSWNTVLTGRTPRAQAGSLPVAVGPSAAADSPAKVRVEMVGHRGDGVLLRVDRSDGVKRAGKVSLQVDYQSFRHAYGGDWALRLVMMRLPDCALTTPDRPGCRTGTPIPTRNDGSGVLTADVDAAPSAGLFGVQAASAGGAGDFKASSLSPSATWQVGGSSGDFNWSYPMDVPPNTGGPAAQLALDYSSGGVDGRTAATNNQPSWAGEGFEFTPGGFVERKYKACSLDLNGNNGTRKTGDLCWGTDNASLTLNGKASELVRDDQTGVWRPRGDDGSKVEKLSGADNGDNDGEHWLITTKDGTKFFFGLNKLPGATTQRQNSSWTVPVFGNHGGEQCHVAGNFAASWCQQSYRWNLDYVVDRHGNTMSLFYDTENNYYARNLTATSVSSYVRAGNVRRIEYGQRDGQVFSSPAVARVWFDAAERCISGTQCSTSQPATYPDTPLDQACNSSTNCDNKFNPSFWTTKRLAKVSTQIWRGTAFADVESWTLRHSFPDPGDGTRPGLWLDAIANAGHVGGSAVTPDVSFSGVSLANRVDAVGDGFPPMNWWRVSAVHYGTGGVLTVTYSDKDCKPGDVPAPDTNGRRCHPVKWTTAQGVERQDFFHKYVVSQVAESDRVSAMEPVVTTVDYLSPPAWHHDEEDGLVEINRKTWSQWRGYERVRVRKGTVAGQQSITENRYFRGMDGDKLAGGGVKDVRVTDSTGASVEDVNQLAGQLREKLTFDGGTMIDRSITDQWISAPTATRVRPWGTTQAFAVEDQELRQDQLVEGGGLRRNLNKNTFNTNGAVTQASDLNDVANPNDDTCTRYEYASNPAAGIGELPSREHVVKVACDKPWTKDDVIADERIYFDNSPTPGGTPVRGDATKGERLSGFDASGNPTYQTVFTAGYDALGRQTSVTDALGKATQRAFTPADGGPLTKVVETLPNGHQTTTELEPAFGEETAITAPDGRTSRISYDAMGRTSKVWLPGRSTAETPNMEYGYALNADAPGVVTTKTLQADGSIDVTWELSDGLLRTRQVQEAAPGGGRMVTDKIYDSRGLEVKSFGPYYNDAPPNDQVLLPDEALVPTVKVTEYDQAERPKAEILRSENAEKWRTTHVNFADRQTVDPPTGEQPATRITDAQGRLVELRQFTGDTPSGGFDKTSYSYNPAGQLTSVTDPAGNRWSFEYDLRGRKIRESDPDKGVTAYTYNNADQLTSSTDARGITLTYSYDEIGRKTAVHHGASKQVEWVYDTLAKGSPTSATRYVDGQAYTTRVTGYDPGGRVLGTEVTIPASEGALAGTYRISNTYNSDGEVATTSLPAVGGLPAETLRFGYNAQDLPTTLTSELGTYVTGTSYTPFGEPSVITMKHGTGKWLQHKYEYETGTRRLARVVTEKETLPRRIANVTYEYNPGGNVTKITDTPSSTSGEPTDTQCFNYDHLRRLTAAWTPSSGDCAAAPSVSGLGGPAAYWHQWTFDLTGNRKTETRTSTAGTTTSTYEYPAAGQPRPHALQKVTTTGPAGTKVDDFAYDATGNMTVRNGETFTWDAEGKLEKATLGGQETKFVYDADGNRLLRRDATGTTLYMAETEVLLKPTGELAGTRYYNHGEQTVAVRHAGQLVWLGADHHGTNHIAVDQATQQVQRRRSGPYGESRGPAPAAWPGQRGFVGGTNDESTGLVHLGAREYDPSTGRFISVDPVADYNDPQQLNGYAYANNSPVTFTDPDGQLAWIPVIILAVRLAPVVVRVARAVPTIVRTVAPVVRTVAQTVWQSVRNFFGWLFSKAVTIFKQITEWVTRFVTQIKTVFENVTNFVKQVVQTIKRVPVKQTARKPASKAKQQTKQQNRNTKSPKKPEAKKPSNPKKPEAKKPGAKPTRKQAKEHYKKHGYYPNGGAPVRFNHVRTNRPPGEAGRAASEAARELSVEDLLGRVDPSKPHPSTWNAQPDMDPVNPAYHPDGTPKYGPGSRFDPDRPTPTSRGGRWGFVGVTVARLLKRLFE